MIGDGGVTPHFIEMRKKMAVIGAILGDIGRNVSYLQGNASLRMTV